MAAVLHLGFVWGIFGLGGLYHSAQFGYDRCSSFYNMNGAIFGVCGRNTPIHDSKIVVLGAI